MRFLELNLKCCTWTTKIRLRY